MTCIFCGCTPYVHNDPTLVRVVVHGWSCVCLIQAQLASIDLARGLHLLRGAFGLLQEACEAPDSIPPGRMGDASVGEVLE